MSVLHSAVMRFANHELFVWLKKKLQGLSDPVLRVITIRAPMTTAEAQNKSSGISNGTRRRLFAVSIPIVASVLAGVTLGGGIFTFDYAKGTSYLSSESETCANCHIMQDHFDAWVKSTHHHVAKCNDCHAPHDFIGKWYCKGRNGFFHSLAFTTQNFHDPIMINDYNRGVVEANCRYCHSDFTHAIDTGVGSEKIESLACIRCHQDVGHPN